MGELDGGIQDLIMRTKLSFTHLWKNDIFSCLSEQKIEHHNMLKILKQTT